MIIQQFLITMLIAIIGGFLALKIKVPAGTFVGAMLCVAIFNVCFELSYFPPKGKIIVQCIAGAFIARNINKDNIKEMRYIHKPLIIMIVGMFINNIIIGFMIYHFTNIDLQTALFCATPGGLVEMSLISSDYGANVSYVALMQLTRVLFVVLVFPSLMAYLSHKIDAADNMNKGNDEEINTNQFQYDLQYSSETRFSSINTNNTIAIENETYKTIKYKLENYFQSVDKSNLLNLIKTFVLAIISGFTGYYLGIPAGALVVSMIVVSIYNVKTGNAFMPLKMRRAAQICSGALIGTSVIRADILTLYELSLAAFILVVGLSFLNLTLGYIIFRASKFDLVTSLFSTAPAGSSDMILISDEIGADSTKVSVLQIIRVISAVSLFPILLSKIIYYFS